VTLRVTDEGDKILFTVMDNGIGMDEEVKEKVFKRFFTTKGNKGTGLGLCVSHKVIQEMGGEITFESEKGVGTSFRIAVPKIPVESTQEDISSQRKQCSFS